MTMKATIRPALATEIPALDAIIEQSARALSQGYYTKAEIEAAITHVFGVDSELVADGTYLVAEKTGEPGILLGCGGWSRRATLFGGDRFAARQSGLLDPAHDPAKIRAFFVAPDAARSGVGRALLDACESAARAAGFRHYELMATLPGEPFYATCGYTPIERIAFDCDGTLVPFVKMTKPLAAHIA